MNSQGGCDNRKMVLRVPATLNANCRKTPERARWLELLPERIRELGHRWSLRIHAPFCEVSCAWVAPVTLESGEPAVLKLGIPHYEGAHESQGLRFWNGDATVRILRFDDAVGGMLLERCEPGTPLRTLPEPEQDVVIAKLLLRLWRIPSAPHLFRPLSSLTEYWSYETRAREQQWPDAGLVREGLKLMEELPRSAPREVLLATDLHAGNVLRSKREPWLAIDPKPFTGDPAFDTTQHLFNCETRLLSDPDGTIRRIAELTSLDHERVRLWTFARAAAEPRDNWSANSFALARTIARTLR